MSELRLPEINRVILGGRLTHDPEPRFAGDGTPVTDFALAFHRRYRARDGQAAEETGFVAVRVYGRLAEVCGTYLKKGSPVLVEGRLQMREWKGAPGPGRTRLEIRAENVHFMAKSPVAGERPAPGATRSNDEGGRAPS